MGDASRLAIVEALEEGPRQIPELARLVGIHRTTVQGHLDKLMAAGLVDEEPGVPGGRGRPSKRYRLRIPLLIGDPELRLFVGSLVSLIRKAYSENAAEIAEEEGLSRGRQLARPLRHPTLQQTTREVVAALEHFSFAPSAAVRANESLAVDLHSCPFRVAPGDPDGPVVCAFHEGLVRGVAQVASGDHDVGVRVEPFSAPGLCRVELSAKSATTIRRRRDPAQASEGNRRQKARGQRRSSS